LAVTNVLLLAHILLPRRLVARWLRRLTTSERPPLGRQPSDQQSVPGHMHSTPLGADLGGLLGKDYLPPLPQPVADALDRSCLCFLATAGTGREMVEPHLSLMRYTYTSGLDPDDDGGRREVMVISTQRKTKKFDILTQNENVALLVHDFTTHREGDGANYESLGGEVAKYSITLNGTVRVEEGELAERYRAVHLARNEAYGQFIVGDDIAIITVKLTRARVCDVHDNVTNFARDPNVPCAWNELTYGKPSKPV